MTIAAPIQTNAANAAASSDTVAMASDVTAGSLILIKAMQTESASNAFVAGDCTQTAGTAVLDTIALDVSNNINFQGPVFMRTAIWSCLVTTGGSLTMQVSNGASVFWTGVAVEEHGGSWDGSRLEASNSNGSATDNTNADTGNASSAGIALFTAIGGTTDDGTPAITPDGAFTQTEEEALGTGPTFNACYRISTGSLTDSGSWTLGNNRGWSCALAVYAEAAGGGLSIPIAYHHLKQMGSN